MSMSEPWIGPFGMCVDNSTPQVPSADGVNSVFREGYETEKNNNGGKLALGKDEYLAKYAEKRDGDERFWFKGATTAEKK